MHAASPFSLKNKLIVITGASSGIGRQCAVTFDQLGARLILIGRSNEALLQTASLLNSQSTLIVTTDITDYTGTEEKVKDILKGLNKIDGIIHAAGISTTLPLQTSTPERLQLFFQTNVFAAIQLTKILTKRGVFNPEGMSVVFITSVMGVVGEAGKTIYGLTKGALVAGSKSLALELAAKKIRVNCVAPGVVESPMSAGAVYAKDFESYEKIKSYHPLGFGKPEDVANACAFLMADASRWITGTNLIVDGGYTAR